VLCRFVASGQRAHQSVPGTELTGSGWLAGGGALTCAAGGESGRVWRWAFLGATRAHTNTGGQRERTESSGPAQKQQTFARTENTTERQLLQLRAGPLLALPFGLVIPCGRAGLGPCTVGGRGPRVGERTLAVCWLPPPTRRLEGGARERQDRPRTRNGEGPLAVCGPAMTHWQKGPRREGGQGVAKVG